jgi:predicted RNase H-like nuclease (RuvC/YqgF family)
MTSVQENKNELEAAVRYCESAITRAKQTIESMEFRQQAATKAWHEQTGREESLTKKVEFLTKEYNNMKQYADKLLDENVEVGERNDSLKERVNLRDDQIAMLKRKLAKRDNPYPFREGDLYYVINQLDGTWVESVWDDESESMHDNTNVPGHPHKVYFTVDQKHVLDKFNSES